jgi:multiple sugar transport system substrate-binding protein
MTQDNDKTTNEALETGLTRRAFSGRALAAGASLTSLSGLLAACGGGSSTTANGKATLTFWKFAAENDDPVIKEAVARWNKAHADTQILFQTFPPDQYSGTKLTTAFAGGHGPDVFWMSPGNFINYVNNGIAAPVDDIVDKSTYNPAAVKAVSNDGKMYAVPFEEEPVALYYRTDMLDAAGLQPPKTWPELLSTAKALTTSKTKGIVIEPSPGPYQNFTWYPFLWSAGGEVVNADSTKSALRTPQAASAFQLWGDIMRQGLAPKKTSILTADIGPMGRGEAAMQVCGFWAIAQLKNMFPKVKYGVVPLPIAPGGKQVTVYGGWTQMINANGKHVEQAKAFTKWLWTQDKKFPQEWACRHNSKFSPNPKINQACADVFDTKPYSIFKDEILPTARAEPRYPNEIVKAVGDGLQAVMFSGKSGQEAANTAADAIDSYLSSYKGAPLNPAA